VLAFLLIGSWRSPGACYPAAMRKHCNSRTGRRFVAIFAAAGVSLFGANAARALPLAYDCDTAAGSYSEISQQQAAPPYRVTGRLTALQRRTHERFLPSAQIRLEGADQRSSVVLRMVPTTRDGDRFTVALATTQDADRDRDREPQADLLITVGINQPVPFELSVSEGEASVRVGVERRTVPLRLGRGARLRILCSTGEFLFDELDWSAGA
jgi:hypothetical protein